MPRVLASTLRRAAVIAALAVAGGCSHMSAPANRPAAGGGAGEAQPRAAALAPDLVASAAAYERYMRRAGQIRSDFRDGAAVREALITGAGYERGQLQEGAVAYAALAALQDPTFVRSVRALDRNGQNALVSNIAINPAAALQIRGADGAAALAAGALGTQGEQVASTGRAVKQAAYTVQHQKWSKAFVPDRPSRLARTKALSATRFRPGPEDTSAALAAVREAPRMRSGAPTPFVQRAVALAALAAMGRAGDSDSRSVAPLLAEPRSADCLKMAKLNLFQCLAVSGPHYEDVFCLGQHALMDTGRCIAEAGGAPKASRRAEAGGDRYAARSNAAPAPIEDAVG
jgi:hypothetical protein